MAYDLFPGVDENYLLPPEVRGALALSPELRSLVIPMTQTARNNLTGDELWDNRLIFNTTTDRIDRYDLSSTTWIQVTTEPPGVVKEYAGDTAPAFHVMADGSVYPTSGIYAGLAAVCGTKYNTGGEGAGNFRVINKKGRIGVGRDSGQAEFATLGQTGGEKSHVLTEAEIAAHDHAGSTGGENVGHTHPVETKDITPGTLGGGGGSLVREGYVGMGSGRNTGGESTGHVHGFATDSAGGNGAHNNLKPYVVTNYIITL